jgi:hypothetical protein
MKNARHKRKQPETAAAATGCFLILQSVMQKIRFRKSEAEKLLAAPVRCKAELSETGKGQKP